MLTELCQEMAGNCQGKFGQSLADDGAFCYSTYD
jgi:hypothetical protein